MKKDMTLMKRLNQVVRDFKDDERGLTTVEYVIVLILICVIAIAAWRSFGAGVKSQVDAATSSVNTLRTP